MESVSAYKILTTDWPNAIITKLSQNIKQIELYTNFRIWEKEAWLRSRDVLLNFGVPSTVYLWNGLSYELQI